MGLPQPATSKSLRSFTSKRTAPSFVCKAKNESEQATLPKTYTFHTPGSVQEPGNTGNPAIFKHQTPEEAAKWENVPITHIGDRIINESEKKIGVVLGEFHNTLMDDCLEDARLAAIQMNARISEVVWVPGSYEAPLVVKSMLDDGYVDCVVVLGYIEKGDTLHGQEMGSTCSLLLKQLELEYQKPVGMGIIGPGATAEQAAKRVAYAGNATRAAVRLSRHMEVVKHRRESLNDVLLKEMIKEKEKKKSKKQKSKK